MDNNHNLTDILLAIGRLEGKADAILMQQRLHEERLQGLDERVRSLEGTKSFSLGIAAVIAAIVSLATTLLRTHNF